MVHENKGPVARPIDPGWAWAPYEPDVQRPWNLVRAGHLYRRAGFGGDWPRLQQALADGPQRSIDKLLDPGADLAEFNRTYDGYADTAGGAPELRAWWLRRMILTPHPLLEKMTLFWHGHFGVSASKVSDARLMSAHVELLRKSALGSYASMVEAVSQDPAVLVALGSDVNRKAQPNQNLARELFRRFSLGEGNYTDEDVHEAARAMTGWFVLNNRLRYFEREHDPNVKKILGREGPWERADVVRIALAQPAAPQLIVGKLYRWLISETDPPGDALLAPLAESFGRDYDISKLVEAMLRSNLFFSPTAYRQRIKGPVEFAVGIARAMEGLVPTMQLGGDLAAIGQALYDPPTVKGWPGGRAWINEATLVRRSNLAAALLGGGKPYGDHLDPRRLASKYGHDTPEAAAPFFVDLLFGGDLQADVVEAVRGDLADAAGGEPDGRLRRFVHGLVTLPEFQLA